MASFRLHMGMDSFLGKTNPPFLRLGRREESFKIDKRVSSDCLFF